MENKSGRIKGFVCFFLLFLLFILAAYFTSYFLCSEYAEIYTPNGNTIVYRTSTGHKYHVQSCGYLHSSKIPILLSEAVCRYGRCSKCDPPELVTPGDYHRMKHSQPIVFEIFSILALSFVVTWFLFYTFAKLCDFISLDSCFDDMPGWCIALLPACTWFVVLANCIRFIIIW